MYSTGLKARFFRFARSGQDMSLYMVFLKRDLKRDLFCLCPADSENYELSDCDYMSLYIFVRDSLKHVAEVDV